MTNEARSDFNGLTEAEAERLALLLEEMGEAQQAVGKLLRHGYASRHPDGGPYNGRLLEIELGHIMAVLDLMETAGDIDYYGPVQHARTVKHQSMKPYLHHQAASGAA